MARGLNLRGPDAFIGRGTSRPVLEPPGARSFRTGVPAIKAERLACSRPMKVSCSRRTEKARAEMDGADAQATSPVRNDQLRVLMLFRGSAWLLTHLPSLDITTATLLPFFETKR